MDFVFKDLKRLYESFNKLKKQYLLLEQELKQTKKENDLLKKEIQTLKQNIALQKKEKALDLFADLWEENREDKEAAKIQIDRMVRAIDKIIKGLKHES